MIDRLKFFLTKVGGNRLIAFVALSIILAILIFNSTQSTYSDRNLSCGGSTCNVILIIADALGAKHLGVYGYERATSPFIDQFFGEEGIVFSEASSVAPWTNPSFGSIFTSLYPSEIYVETFSDYLSPSIPTFINSLRKSGVSVAAFNKDSFLGLKEPNWGTYGSFKSEEEIQVITDPLMFNVAGQWLKGRLSEESVRTKPFFALIHTLVVHDPYNPPVSYQGLFDGPLDYPGDVTSEDLIEASSKAGGPTEEDLIRFRRQYDQEIRYLDDTIRSFISELPQEILSKSIIILTADHGEGFGEHGKVGHANSLYQELLHVPLLVKIPGKPYAHLTQPVSLLDLPTTILDIFGLSKPTAFKGVSILPLIKGEDRPQSIVKAELGGRIWPENAEDYFDIRPKIRTEPLPVRNTTSLRFGNWKVISNYGSSFELYNLGEDPQERNNMISNLPGLSSEDRATVEKLLQMVK